MKALAAALVMAVLASVSACGAGTQVEMGSADATGQVVGDARSTVVSSPSVIVRTGILPTAELAAVSDYIAVQKSVLEECATLTPDLEVGAVITFSHGRLRRMVPCSLLLLSVWAN